MLYRLTRLARPARVVELGSGLGRSGAYIAAALAENGAGRFITIEGTRWRHDVARDLIEAVAPGHTEAVHGRFEDHFDALDGAGLVFIDGSHSRDATLAYADEIVRRAARPALVVFDDVEGYSDEMESAWRETAALPMFELIGEALRVGVLGLGDVHIEAPPWASLSPATARRRTAVVRVDHWREVVGAGALSMALRRHRDRGAQRTHER
jgi:hypothetical protein